MACDGRNNESNNESLSQPLLNADASSFNPPPSISDDNSDYVYFKKHMLVLNQREILSSPKGKKHMDYKIIKIIDITHKLTKQLVFSDEIQFLRIALEIKQIIINSLLNIIERNQHPEGVEKKKIINGGKGTNVGNPSKGFAKYF